MREWQAFALVSAFFAGLTAVLAKIGVKAIPANLATWVRTCVVIFFLGSLITWRKEWRNPFLLDQKSLIFLILSGITTGLSWLFYFRALQSGPASLVSSLDKLSLLFAILLSILFLGERLNGYQWAGASFIFVGAILLVFQ